jgi:hypothetical protein
MAKLPDLMNPRVIFSSDACETDVECDYCGNYRPLKACVCFPLWSLRMWGEQKHRWAVACNMAHLTANLQPEGLA